MPEITRYLPITKKQKVGLHDLNPGTKTGDLGAPDNPPTESNTQNQDSNSERTEVGLIWISASSLEFWKSLLQNTPAKKLQGVSFRIHEFWARRLLVHLPTAPSVWVQVVATVS